MTRYGFAIKALPKGGKPFGDKEDDDEQPEGTEEETLEEGDPSAAFEELPETPEVPAALPDPAAPAEDPAAADPAAAEPPPDDPAAAQPPPDGQPPADMPEPPADDARPWAGDMYDEGDETDPADSFSAYTGSNGEQAWLDRAPDGTLTGWVRDGTGQVWRYTDPDAWAVDVDGAGMTRTHSQADEVAAPPEAAAPPAPGNRGVQDSMFQ
ncbi:hypothetical protein [Streptomyces ardesiacus]|uniref:hypothetical protein n=1 Tax=Streptomyces ardesiacus TaxID=285564 RepID=UPI000D58E3C8|nr:hypothetical protein [Streptomyces ardesiacus]